MALFDNILAYWNLNDDGSGQVSLADSTGNGYTLTDNGGVSLGTGIIAGDAVFDGTDYLASSISLNGLSAFSFSAWVKTTSNGENYILGNWSNNDNYQTVLYAIGGNSYFVISTDAGQSNVGGIPFDDGNWHHLVGTWDGTNAKFYFDGTLSDTKTNSGNLQNSADGFDLGRGAGSGSSYLNGQLDEVGCGLVLCLPPR